MAAVIVAATVVFPLSTALAAPCSGQPAISVEMREAPITVVWNIPLADLRAMSARLPQRPAHPVLGFYAGAVGYVLRNVTTVETPPEDGSACAAFRIDASIVVVDRRIAVASDLVGGPCRQRTALDHYRRHAAAASLALHRFVAELPSRLGAHIARSLHSQPPTSAELRELTDSFLDAALGAFNASMPQMQRTVETKDEIERLSVACDET